MKITNKFLNIPPYISTSWKNVASLRMEENTLLILLIDKTQIKIPNLNPSVIKNIFECHVESLEHAQIEEQNPIITRIINEEIAAGESPVSFAIGSINEMGTFFQHNPAQSNLPPMPQEILDKIVSITKMIAPNDELVLPTPEENCNCVHCQIGRALVGTTEIHTKNLLEEEVKPEELTFQEWNIQQTGDKLYSIQSRLDPNEHYNVFLGDPIGCTCGNTKCDHILAVLKT